MSGRTEGLRFLRGQPFVVDARKPIGMNVALEALHVMHIVRQHHHTARGVHDVIVQLVGERLPELHRVLVDRLALLPEVIRADDRGVAPGIAAAEPALLEDSDVTNAVFLGEVIGGREPMPTSTDDHDIIGRFGLRIAPLPRPALMGIGSLTEKAEDRVLQRILPRS